MERTHHVFHIRSNATYDLRMAKAESTSVRRTTLFLDPELLRQAQEILHTNSQSATVRAALYELVALRRRLALLDMELPDLTLEAVEQARQDRVFEDV